MSHQTSIEEAMVLLDTNVVSELMRPAPSAKVLVWMDALPPRDVFVSAITGRRWFAPESPILPAGARRRGLTNAVERTLGGLFASRVLPFDSDAARACAGIVAGNRAADRPISQSDRQIAGTARSRGKAVATRYVRAFFERELR